MCLPMHRVKLRKTMPLDTLTIHQAHEGLRTKQFSAVELTDEVLQRIAAVDGGDHGVHAFLSVDRERARTEAAAVDARIAAGEELEPLAGIPLAVKDVIAVAGEPLTAASRMLEHYRSPYSATVFERLQAAGMVYVGKTNLDEFAHGASTENSAFGVTRNPWDLSRVAGGSSGGSAAAVAAGECLAALGTDTGGSVRHPAAFCGVVGLKPTYGRASRYGLIAMTSSTDVPGVLTRTVADAALLLQAFAGRDPRDATTSSQPVADYVQALDQDVRGLTVGLPKEFFGDGLQPEVAAAVQAVIDALAAHGIRTVSVSLPHSQRSIAAYYVITPSEISANLSRFDGIRYGHAATTVGTLLERYQHSRGEGFGAEPKRRIMLGTYALSAGYYDAYYLQAQKVRTVIRQEAAAVLEQCDVLLTPTAPHPAFPIGAHQGDPLGMYLEDVYMSLASIAGLPALSVPCGFVEGLPVGFQLIGRPFAEDTILRLGHAYQQLTDWHTAQPVLVR